MVTETMISRQPWHAAVRLDPLDRLPFGAKLSASYTRAQSAPFREMPFDELRAFSDRIHDDPARM